LKDEWDKQHIETRLNVVRHVLKGIHRRGQRIAEEINEIENLLAARDKGDQDSDNPA